MEQCKGITKSGKRCKNTQGLVDGYCRLHRDQAADDRSDVTDKKTHDDYPDDERSFTDVASEVNNGISTLWLVATVLLSVVIYWFFKGKKKKKRKKK